MPKPSQSQPQKILSSKIAIAGLLIILFFISWAVVKNLSNQKAVDIQSQKLKQEIQELGQQNIDLAVLIDYFATKEFIEREAREKLNLGKPGEKVVIVPQEKQEKKDEGVLVNDSNNKDGETKAKPKKWLEYFFSSNH